MGRNDNTVVAEEAVPLVIAEEVGEGTGIGGATSGPPISSSSSSESGVHWEGIFMTILVLLGGILLISHFVVIGIKIGMQNKQQAVEVEASARKDEEALAFSSSEQPEVVHVDRDQFHKTRQWLLSTALFTALVGFAIAIAANVSCSLVEIDFSEDRLRGIGLWRVTEAHQDYTYLCTSTYPQEFDFDAAFQSARAFGVLAAIVGGFCCICLLRSLCVNPLRFLHGLCLTGVLSYATALSLGLTLLVLQSSNCHSNSSGAGSRCTYSSTGSGMFVAVGVAYWFLTGVALTILPSRKV